MEFKNLDYNILYVLGKDCCRAGTSGPFEMNIIFTEFSDIPAEDLTAEFTALDKKGLLVIHGGGQQFSLTAKGKAKVESLYPCRQWRDKKKFSV